MAALSDPRRRERSVVTVLAAYCGLWTLYGAIAKGSQDIHFDMGEMIAWSREAGWGTPKHPPLGAWLVRAWFGVFPLADWAYYLFAMVLATLALWIAWRVSARYLDAEKRVVGLALLTLVPFFNFHALKFNANTIMLPLWAATTALFLRSYETRSSGLAALAGLAAAAAMLGKYWSIVLLLGLGVAALADRRRAAYFGSPAPWITVAVGAVGLAPHVMWLWAHDFTPFAYAMESHPGTLIETLGSGIGYVAGAAAYAALPVLLVVLAARPSAAAIRDAAWPQAEDRRLAVLAFWLPLGLPILFAVAAHELIISLWSIGSMTLLPVVLLGSPRIAVPKPAVRRVVGVAIALPLIALAASPLVAVVIHRQGVPNYATHYRLVAQAVDKAWRETTDKPLRLVGSYNNLLYGIVFYFPERPSTLEIVNPYLTPWTDNARVARDGIALVCPVEETLCVKALDQRAANGPAGRRVEVEISRRYAGVADKADRFVIATVPPRE
ncbi:MAG TPA: glycosyltransferase family 39 protein [Xanthobacteraceae bacterium]